MDNDDVAQDGPSGENWDKFIDIPGMTAWKLQVMMCNCSTVMYSIVAVIRVDALRCLGTR